MQNWHQLELLRLSLNQFAAFPDWLFQLPKLAWLALGANPACPVAEGKAVAEHSLQQYQLLQKLGEGASGVIYQAGFGQEQLALKQFKGWVTSDGCPKDEMNNYLNAGEHPNLIPIKAKLTDSGLPGLVMELVPQSFAVLGLPPSFESCSRDTFHPGQQLSLAGLEQLLKQVVSVMAHLHQQQICHGDFYAHNMLVNAEHQLYLGDFGAATALQALPAHQQQLFYKLEVLAFAYWLLDMQTLLSDKDLACFRQKYSGLLSLCLVPDVSARPDFALLKLMLQQIELKPE
jgi:serine/threonine protein kinase